MNKLYEMTSKKEEQLWKDAIFIFDSSSLLDLYYLPFKTRKKLYSQIFERYSERLWIPSHVKFEYYKNRKNIIKKPLQENFLPLEEKVKDILKESTRLSKKIDSIINLTKNDNKHPYVEQKDINIYKTNLNNFLNESENFEKIFLKQINDSKKEILDIEKNDDVLESIENYFKVGEDFSFEKILEITREGEHRYKYKIPPGYGDLDKKEKKGTQIFGDLIIWKQILEYSKRKKKPIIFITNDISKDEDWCYITKEKKIIKPREELIKEINDVSFKEFWIYTLSDFLYKSNKYLDSSIDNNSIEKVLPLVDDNLVDLGLDYKFDLKYNHLFYENKQILLSIKEQIFFNMLIQAKGDIVSFESIEFRIWPDGPVSSSTIRTLIYRIRAKLNDKLIEVIPSLGCRLKRVF